MNWGSLLKYTLIPVRPKLASLPHLTASTHLHSNTLIRVKVQTTLSVERSRYKNLRRECRFCHLCNDNMIRDVFILYSNVQLYKHSENYFYLNIVKPLKYIILFTYSNINIINRLCKYIIEASKLDASESI